MNVNRELGDKKQEEQPLKMGREIMMISWRGKEERRTVWENGKGE